MLVTFVLVLKRSATCSAGCYVACRMASYVIWDSSTNESTCMTIGGVTTLGVPTTSSCLPKFWVVPNVGVGFGCTESCQSKSNWLGKSCRVISWVMGMWNVSPTCMSPCLKGESIALSLECGSRGGCASSKASGLPKLPSLSQKTSATS